jgi:hypothetical protein
MRPKHCTSCQGHELYHATMESGAPGGVLLRLGFLSSLPVKGAVCLSCGAITPYLESEDLDKLRTSKAEATIPKEPLDI